MNEILFTGLTRAELENLIKECLRQVITEKTAGKEPSEDETGGVELAMRITGYARSTIYSLVSQRILPHAKQGKKLWFSRADLTTWIKSGKRKTLDDLKMDERMYLRTGKFN